MRYWRISGPCAALLLFSTGLAAQPSTWFTVIGDPANAAIDTVQVDPVDHDHDVRTLNVRVNRSQMRESWDKVSYRSYVAKVQFNCEERTARYLEIDYFARPLWQDDSKARVDYTKGPDRPMLFLDMKPNPTQRIIHAACTVMAKRPRSSRSLHNPVEMAMRWPHSSPDGVPSDRTRTP